jgi:hypothetical protein
LTRFDGGVADLVVPDPCAVDQEAIMSSQVAEQAARRPIRHRLAGCTRWLRLLAVGGVLLQASGGCSQDLTNFVNTMREDIVKGIGTGLTSLAEALVLNMFT